MGAYIAPKSHEENGICALYAQGPTAAHLAIVLDGKPGTAMQAFAKQLSDLDLAAVVSYERNAWGNKTGDGVQPRDVAALRK